MTYKEFLEINTRMKGNIGVCSAHVERFYVRNSACVIKSVRDTYTIAVSELIAGVIKGLYTLENPSLIKNWKGFDENNASQLEKRMSNLVADDLDKFACFITNRGVVLVRDEEEFDKFILWLKYHKVEGIVGNKIECFKFDYWQHMAKINRKNPDIFLFEYQYGKGFTWDDDLKRSKEWYGRDPIVL